MLIQKLVGCGILLTWAIWSGLALPAAETSSRETVITIDGEMCGGCVKKMQDKLAEVSGIESSRGDVKAKTMTIVPKARTTLSSKELWETIEAAGKKPAKLVGPQGTFTKKPQS